MHCLLRALYQTILHTFGELHTLHSDHFMSCFQKIFFHFYQRLNATTSDRPDGFCLSDAVDGSEILRSPVEVGSLSHYSQGLIHPRWVNSPDL